MRYLPNLLSAARFPLSLAILIATSTEQWQTAFWLFLAACFTDYVDGPLARHYDATSKLGDKLDHNADFALFVCTVLGLTIAGKIPWYLPVEFIIITLMLEFANRRKLSIAAVTPRRAAFGGVVLVGLLAILAIMIAIAAYGFQLWEIIAFVLGIGLVAITKRDRLRTAFQT